jgi:multidrug efflux system membrane fusion protein
MLLRLCGGAVLLALCACSGVEIEKKVDALETPLVPVRVIAAEIRSIPIEIRSIGNVEAITTIVVRSQVTGVIHKAHVRGGETVDAGAPLFEIDERPYEQAVRLWEANLARDKALLVEAEAELERAEAQDAYAAQQLERAEQLALEGVWSKDRVQQARSEAGARRSIVQAEAAAIESARSTVGASEAALASARLQLSFCQIRSPIAGRVGSLEVHAGNLVQAESDTLVSIRQTAPIDVTFSVPEAHLADLVRRQRRGSATVRASIPGEEQEPRGTLTFLDNAIDAATGTLRLKATFPNLDARLWPGQFVDVRVALEERPNAVVVPSSAIQTGQDGPFVYVVGAGGQVELRQVVLGPAADRVVSILDGVKPGEQVVTEGHLRIGPGTRVETVS